MAHLGQTKVMFECQGHWVKVKVTLVKYQGECYLKVKVILRSRSFQNQMANIWISIPKRTVGLRPSAFLFNNSFGLIKQ